MLYHANQLDAIAATRPDRVNGLLLALGASLAWGVADFVGPWQGTHARERCACCSGRRSAGSRRSRSSSLARGEAPDDAAVLLAIPAAISGTLGLYAYYRGMAIGAMAVVAPIAGASAIVPVVFGIAHRRPALDRPVRRDRVRARRRRARLAGAPGGRASGGWRRASGSRCSRRSGSASTSRRCTPPARPTPAGPR